MHAASVIIWAAGGKVQTTICMHDLQPDPADAGSATSARFQLALTTNVRDSLAEDNHEAHPLFGLWGVMTNQ
jgi:hypothetical protein